MAKAPSLIERLGRVWQLSDHVVACRFERSGALAFALGDGSLTIIPHADGEPLTVQAHAGGCLSLAAAPGGGFISGGDDGRFLAISVAGEVTELANYPGRWLDNVSSHPAGVIACSEGKRLHLTRIGKPTISFEYPSTVGGFCFSPDSKRVAVAHYGGVSIRAVDDQHSGVLTLKWAGSHLDVTWSPDSRFILSAMQENCIRGWRLKDKQDFHMSGYASKVKSWAWVAGGRYLATSGADVIPCWPFSGRKGPLGKAPVSLGYAESGRVTAVAAAPDYPLVAAGYDDGLVLVTQLADGDDNEQAAVIKPAGGGGVTDIAWALDGKYLAVATEQGFAGILPTAA